MKRGNACSICGHAERSVMEFALASGVGRRALGKRHGVSPDALARHYKHHLSEEQREQLKHFARLQRDPGSVRRAARESGIITWYRQQAGIDDDKSKPTHAYMRLPANFCATFYGANGVPYSLQPGQIAKIRVEDTPHLRALGAIDINSVDELNQ